ncbi:M56 family metallopeptidase [Evtepia sp.]
MEAFLQTLLTMSATAAVAAGIVMLLRLPLKRAPRWITCALWAVVLLRMVLPGGLDLPVGLVPQGVSSGAYVEQVLPAAPAEAAPADPVPADPAPQTETPTQTPAQQTALPDASPEPAAAPAALNWPAILTGIWAAGCLACLLWAALSYWRLRRQVAEAVLVSPLMAAAVYESDQIPSPFVCGFFRPRIYLPAGLDPDDRAYVLLHERAHLRRWDHRTKLLAWLALSVHWFNPVLWVAYRLYCRDVEAACDQAVIRTFDREDTARYAETLLHLGRRTPFPAVLPLAFGEEDAKHRIRGVLTYKKPAFWLVLAAAIACVVAAVLLLADRNPTEPQLDGEPVTGGQVVQVLELDAPWTAHPTATTTVPLPEEMVRWGVGLLDSIDLGPFSPSEAPDPLPDRTVILPVDHSGAVYYLLCPQYGQASLYFSDGAGNCTQAEIPARQQGFLDDWMLEVEDALNSSAVAQLYACRTPYVGSASDVIAVLGALGISQVLGDYTIELQTSTEPYGVTLWFQSLPQTSWTQEYLRQMGGLALALIDNAGYFACAIEEEPLEPTYFRLDRTEVMDLDRDPSVPAQEAFRDLYDAAQNVLAPYNVSMHRGWCYRPDEFLYFDPALAEFQQVLPYEDRREAYETLSIVTTPYGSLMLYLDEGHGMGTGGATFTQEPDPAAVSTVTTPAGQTFALDADTVLTLYPYEAASGTCYRIYLRDSETYLAYWQEGTLAYLTPLVRVTAGSLF